MHLKLALNYGRQELCTRKELLLTRQCDDTVPAFLLYDICFINYSRARCGKALAE